jgi:hypothetical protein
MRGIPPLFIDSTKLTTPAVAEPFTASAYDAAKTDYVFGELASVANDYAIYECLVANEAGNTPKTSVYKWRKVGPTETAYNAAKTNYALGETCSANHRVYESLVLQTEEHPLPILPAEATAFWLDVGATMRYKMFDLDRNSQTVSTSPMTTVVTPGERVNSLGLVGMVGNILSVKVESSSVGGIIYPLAYVPERVYNKNDCMTVGLSQIYKAKSDGITGIAAPNATYWEAVDYAVFDLNTRNVFDATTYAFAKFATRPTKVIFDMPPVTDCVITVVLSATQGNTKMGGVVIGNNIYLGALQKEAKNAGVSYSSVTTDAFGNTSLVKRKIVPKLTGTLFLKASLVDSVLDARSLLDAEPALYVGIDSDGDWTNAVTILGVCKQLDITEVPGSSHAHVNFSALEI